ncbi:MAG: sugar transferase, partial [Methyloceanibacter sp.]
LVRPGLTGLAQVHGERDMSVEDKNAIDVWYVRNASLWLDLKILLQTPIIVIRGERVDQTTLRIARQALERLKAQAAAPGYSLVSKSALGREQVRTLHSAR